MFVPAVTQALDAGDTVTDVFTYTVDDGNGETDTATITITITGTNDAPTAVADTDSVDAGSTVTDTTNLEGTLVSDDSDPDASASLYITKITGNGNTSNVTYNSTKSSNAATITGSKGTLTFGSDGSYSYTADLNVTTGPDEFTYYLTDGTSTTTATLTIDVVVEHFGYIQEGKTLTVADTAGRENGTSTGDHTGDIIFNDTLDNYTVTQIQFGDNTETVTDVTYSDETATSIDGTYGTLTIGSDGSYEYVANSDIDDLDAGEDNVTDVFTYTEDTGSGTTEKTLTIYIIPSQDLTARADTGTINEGGTLTVADDADETTVVAGTFSSANSFEAVMPGNQTDVIFNDDGTKLYLTSSSGLTRTYTLGTAFDIDTGSYTAQFTHGQVAHSTSFNNDGTKLFLLTSSAVLEYDVSTAFDLSSTTYTTQATLSGEDSTMRGLAFNNDGTKMFAVGQQYDKVYEYDLTSPFDITTLSYSENSYSVNSQENNPTDIRFNHD